MRSSSRGKWKDIGTLVALGLTLALVANLYMTPAVIQNVTVVSTDPTDTPSDYGIKYVEPGNANDIQAKIDACPNSGCMIIIPPGDYYITDSITIDHTRSNIILSGSGTGHPKYGHPDYGVGESDFGATVFHHTSDGNVIEVSGVGSHTREMVDNIMIRNIYFFSGDEKRGHAIYAHFTSESGIKILDSVFIGFHDGAVGMSFTWGLLARGNTFWWCGNATDKTSAIQDLDPHPDANNFIQIVDNFFEGANKNYASIDVTLSTDSYISGNIIEGGPTGIKAGEASRIIGNYLYYPTKVGIYSAHGDTIIQGNHIFMAPEQGDFGIEAYGSAAIIGNHVWQGNWAGIWVGDGKGARIDGNFVGSSGKDDIFSAAIVLKNQEFAVVSNNVLRTGHAGSSGILIRYASSNNVITGNAIEGFRYGIFESVNAGQGSNNIIGNIVRDNSEDDIVTNGEGTEVSHNFEGDDYQGDVQTVTYMYDGDLVTSVTSIPFFAAYRDMEILDAGFALGGTGMGGGNVVIDIRIDDTTVFSTLPAMTTQAESNTFTPGIGVTEGIVRSDGTENLNEGDVLWLDIDLTGSYTQYPSDLVVILVIRNR